MTSHTILVQLLTLLTEIDKMSWRDDPTPGLIRDGSDLWNVAHRIKTQLEAIKDALRERAPRSPGQHQLSGLGGALCTVTVQEAQPVVRKEVDVASLKALLGTDFERLFEVTTLITPKSGFQEALIGVTDPGKVQAVLATLDLPTHKPRVSFQTNGSRS